MPYPSYVGLLDGTVRSWAAAIAAYFGAGYAAATPMSAVSDALG